MVLEAEEGIASLDVGSLSSSCSSRGSSATDEKQPDMAQQAETEQDIFDESRLLQQLEQRLAQASIKWQDEHPPTAAPNCDVPTTIPLSSVQDRVTLLEQECAQLARDLCRVEKEKNRAINETNQLTTEIERLSRRLEGERGHAQELEAGNKVLRLQISNLKKEISLGMRSARKQAARMPTIQNQLTRAMEDAANRSEESQSERMGRCTQEEVRPKEADRMDEEYPDTSRADSLSTIQQTPSARSRGSMTPKTSDWGYGGMGGERTRPPTSSTQLSTISTTQDRLLLDNRALRQQRTELIGLIRRQGKLINVLKRQVAHVRAAQYLDLTRDELLRSLELGSPQQTAPADTGDAPPAEKVRLASGVRASPSEVLGQLGRRGGDSSSSPKIRETLIKKGRASPKDLLLLRSRVQSVDKNPVIEVLQDEKNKQ